jgi:hypothetical protein
VQIEIDAKVPKYEGSIESTQVKIDVKAPKIK